MTTDVLTPAVNAFLSSQPTTTSFKIASFPTFSSVSIVSVKDYENGKLFTGSSSSTKPFSQTVAGISVIVVVVVLGFGILMLVGTLSYKCIRPEPDDKHEKVDEELKR
jgi:hypothetical protein